MQFSWLWVLFAVQLNRSGEMHQMLWKLQFDRHPLWTISFSCLEMPRTTPRVSFIKVILYYFWRSNGTDENWIQVVRTLSPRWKCGEKRIFPQCFCRKSIKKSPEKFGEKSNRVFVYYHFDSMTGLSTGNIPENGRKKLTSFAKRRLTLDDENFSAPTKLRLDIRQH